MVSEKGENQERVEFTESGRGSTSERVSAHSSQILFLVPAPPIIAGSRETSRTWTRAFVVSGRDASWVARLKEELETRILRIFMVHKTGN